MPESNGNSAACAALRGAGRSGSAAVPVQRLHAIVHGQRGITAATDLYLSRYFRRPAGWWLHLQHAFELSQATAALGAKVAREVPRLAAADCLPV